MSQETIRQYRQSPYNGDLNVAAIASEAVEDALALTNASANLGAKMLSASLEFWGGGLKPFAEASRFFKAEAAQPSLDRMPKEAIWEDERAVLYKYATPETLDPGCEHQEIPLVTVFALMNSGTILGRTLIPKMLNSGFDVFWPDWKKPQREAKNSGIEAYFLDTLPKVLEQVKTDAAVEEVSLLGWCQGGYGATILTALQEQLAARAGRGQTDLGIRNLIQLTTPLCVSDADKKCGGFAAMAADPSFDPAKIVRDNGGIFPGALIDHAARGLKEYENNIGTHFNLMRLILDGDEAKITRWEEMNGWTKDLRNMPGQFYISLIEDLYRHNKLVKGTMVLEGMPVNLANLEAAVLTIIAEQDHIVTPPETEGAMDLMGSTDHTIIKKPGGHISVVSPGTCQQISDWLTPRSQPKQ